MENFTPFASLVGGLLVGLSSVLLLFLNGRICGISGISGGLTKLPGAYENHEERLWRLAFTGGLVLGGVGAGMVAPAAFAFAIERSTLSLIVAGFLVGVGTQLGSGCTSGHGICGLGRRSPRSLAAVMTFMVTAFATVTAISVIFGGSL
ncbi:MAG: YeeE/YedE thiosulfate transporter family protein [Myxococcota bacterium]